MPVVRRVAGVGCVVADSEAQEGDGGRKMDLAGGLIIIDTFRAQSPVAGIDAAAGPACY